MLATGNKSELAVGYSTIYGDAVGGFAPIKDVPKTLVWQLARWRNAEAPRRAARPRRSRRARSPSRRRPSCARASSTATRCPPYDVLDAILDDYVERRPRAAPSWSPPASTRRSSTRCCGWSTAPSTSAGSSPPGPKISAQGVRPRPPAADHQPVARARLLRLSPDPLQAVAPWTVSGDSAREPRGATEVDHDRRHRTGDHRPLRHRPRRAAGAPRSASGSTHLQAMKERGERWAMLTAYDQYAAEIFDEAGIPVLLVGDSAGQQRLRLRDDAARSPSTSCCRWCAR